MPSESPSGEDEYDYIVVGSGAGGGPVAANLARAGFTVALLEAGGADATSDYEVPAFFPKVSEDADLRWDYFVRRYEDDTQQRRDPKAVTGSHGLGVWYPRSGTLGGCTAHNALITVCPHASDWDKIAERTGDPSWRAKEMQRYFARIERCDYASEPNFGRPHPGGHGFTGWLTTNIARPKLLVLDWKVFRIALATVLYAVKGRVWPSLREMWRAWRKFRGGPIEFLSSYFDPNDTRTPCFDREGIFFVPFSIERGRRVCVRDLVALTEQDHPDKLIVRCHTLVTRIVFDRAEGAAGHAPRAVGVDYVEGLHLYRGDPNARAGGPLPTPRRMRARREVILAAGAFNTPQLLMLSGVGPREELERHAIQTLVDRPGVGRNLQDRYEISVISKTKSDFRITRGSTFRRPGIGEYPDPQFDQWLKGKGPYATNGVIVSFTRRSHASAAEPDLFIFCVPGVFKGYFPGYSRDIAETTAAHFSWLILKSHTRNCAGTVVLRTSDPRDPPKISFRYFFEGSDGAQADLDAVVEGVRFVRNLNAKLSGFIEAEIEPGADVSSQEALRQFVRDTAWGHHASGTAAMGRVDDPLAVVDSSFRVIGTQGLRIVDASVFPRIPGFFIVTAIYMMAEKASETILNS